MYLRPKGALGGPYLPRAPLAIPCPLSSVGRSSWDVSSAFSKLSLFEFVPRPSLETTSTHLLASMPFSREASVALL